MSIDHTIRLTPYLKIKTDQTLETQTSFLSCCYPYGPKSEDKFCSLCGKALLQKTKDVKIDIIDFDEVEQLIEDSLISLLQSEQDGFHVYIPNDGRMDGLPDLEEDIVFEITPSIISSFLLQFKAKYKKEIEMLQEIYGHTPEILFGVISEYS